MNIENPAVVNDAQGEPPVFCGTLTLRAEIVFTFDESDGVTGEADARDRMAPMAECYLRVRLRGKGKIDDHRFELVDDVEVTEVEFD